LISSANWSFSFQNGILIFLSWRATIVPPKAPNFKQAVHRVMFCPPGGIVRGYNQ
jgi:hypothetical protein